MTLGDMIQSCIHARSVLPTLYIGMLRTCQQMSADGTRSAWADGTQSVWASLTQESCGLSATFQVHWPRAVHISAWASTPASSGLAGAYLYLEGCIKWTKIAQRVVRFERVSQPHVQSVWAECAMFQVHWPMGIHISVWAGTPASSGL